MKIHEEFTAFKHKDQKLLWCKFYKAEQKEYSHEYTDLLKIKYIKNNKINAEFLNINFEFLNININIKHTKTNTLQVVKKNSYWYEKEIY